ncbi:MAG: WhiB family transcriptional regulator [Nocardioides sp.]
MTTAIGKRGLCGRRGVDPDGWYADSGNAFKTRAALDRARNRADSQCRDNDTGDLCPVQLGCLLLAVTRREQYGIWGGLIPYDLDALARERARARLAALLSTYRAGGSRSRRPGRQPPRIWMTPRPTPGPPDPHQTTNYGRR